MKLLKKSQIQAWDLATIEKDEITSFQLMKKASAIFTKWFQSIYDDKSKKVNILCGSGNNGGDGLCVAQFLRKLDYNVEVHLYDFNDRCSSDNKLAQKELTHFNSHKRFTPLEISDKDIIIDALLGTGVNGAVRGEYEKIITWLNQLPNEIISIDIPSGMLPDQVSAGIYVHADHVLSFEVPKVAFFFNEHAENIKKWEYRSISLSKRFIENLKTSTFLIDIELMRSILKPRNKTENKKHFGFAQFCGGSEGMFGSVILASKAAMRCGLGRLGVSTPSIYHNSLFTAVPEVMAQAKMKENKTNLTEFKLINDHLDAIAVGPGLGTGEDSIRYLDSFLTKVNIPCIMDADALNIISRNQWQKRIPKHSILSPHLQEFQRLFGEFDNHYDYIQRQIQKSKELKIYIVLKGAHTSITTPNGECYFNMTGNVGMGTAGSGDVLTGMLLSFLAQGYSPLETCLLGVYLHGLAGDSAASKYGTVAMIASDIIEFIPSVIIKINEK